MMTGRIGNLLFILGLIISYAFGYLRGAGVITEEQLRAILVMIATFLLIATEYRHKVVAAISGVAALWVLGILSGHDMIQFLDMEVLGLLFGMMVVVNSLKVGGFFEWLTVKIANLGMGGLKFFFLITGLTAFLSAFLDNITVSLFMITVGISLSRALGLNVVAVTMGVAAAAVVGGLGTLVGDPPNIMIAAATGLTFNEFLFHMGPIAILAYVVSMGTVLLMFKGNLTLGASLSKVEEVVLEKAQVDIRLTTVGLVSFVGTMILFTLQDTLGIAPAVSAIYAAAVVMILSGERINEVLREVEWDVLIFLGALLVLAGGLEETGVLHLVAEGLISFIGNNELLMVSILLWLSSLLSAVVDNIPVTAALIPVVKEITHQFGMEHLWWTLASGAGIGGIATPVASVPMLLAYRTLEQEGYGLSFAKFSKMGVILMLTVLISFLAYLLLRY